MKFYQRAEQTPEWQCCHWSGRGIPAVRLETHSDREHWQDLFFIMMMRLAASLHMCLSFPPHVSARSSPDEFSGFPAGGCWRLHRRRRGCFIFSNICNVRLSPEWVNPPWRSRKRCAVFSLERWGHSPSHSLSRSPRLTSCLTDTFRFASLSAPAPISSADFAFVLLSPLAPRPHKQDFESCWASFDILLRMPAD